MDDKTLITINKPKKICNFRIVVLFATAMIIGIVFSQAELVLSIVLTSILILTVIFALISHKNKKAFLIAAIACAFFAYGYIFAFTLAANSGKESYVDASVSGRISSIKEKQIVFDNVFINGEKKNGKVEFWLDEDSRDNLNLLILALEGEHTSMQSLDVGYNISFICTIFEVKYNSEPSNASKFQKNVRYSIETITDISSITFGYKRANEQILSFFDKRLRDNLNDDSYALTSAILFGEQSHLEESLLNDFRTNGLVHLFAVSGLHVGIISSLLFLLLKLFRVKTKARYLIVTIFLIFYAWLCGFSPSITRATVMLITYFCMRLSILPNDHISTMSIAAIFILIISPFSLFTLSFQMSFIAVFAIITLGNNFTFILPFIPKKISGLISVSLAVNILLLPVFLYSFKGHSLIYLLANIVMIPLMPFVFCLSLILLIIGLIAPFAPIISLLDFIFMPIIWFNKLLAQAPFAYVELPNIQNLVILIIGAVFFLGAIFASKYIFIRPNIKKILSITLLSIYVVFSVSSVFLTANYNNTLTNKNYADIYVFNVDGKHHAICLAEYNEYTSKKIRYLTQNTNIGEFETIYIKKAKNSYIETLRADKKYEFIYDQQPYDIGSLTVIFNDYDFSFIIKNKLYIFVTYTLNQERLNILYSSFFGETFSDVIFITGKLNQDNFDNMPINARMEKININAFTFRMNNGKIVS